MGTCTYCESKKITHCLVKGSLIQGYEELPVCKKCAEIIDKSNDHYWDSNLTVDLIDLHHQTLQITFHGVRNCLVKYSTKKHKAFKRGPKHRVTYGMKRHIFKDFQTKTKNPYNIWYETTHILAFSNKDQNLV